MNKDQWEEAYKEFDAAHTELYTHERDYKHGSNKKIREQAERKMGYAKHTVEYLLGKYPDVYTLLTGENARDYGKAIQMDEFFQKRYIVGDLGNLLTSMREKIKSFESSSNL